EEISAMSSNALERKPPQTMPHEPTRRTFLAQAATGIGVAVGASWSRPAAIVAQSSANVAQSSRGDRFRVALIGAGERGSEIGRQAAELGELCAVADVNRDAAESFQARVGGQNCKVYQDYRRILDRSDIDAILCGTPDHWHTRISVDAMRAGKDVYCEKPLTLTMDESRTISRVTQETKRVFQVGTQQRSEFERRFLKAVALARSGRLGKQLHALSSVGKALAGGPFPPAQPSPQLDFDFWLGQAPRVDFRNERVGVNFRWWLEYSGGQVTDWGVHHTDIALWALGGEETGIQSAEGQGVFPGLPYTTNVLDFLNGRATLPQQYNVAETFDCHLTLANGNSIQLTSGDNELILSGELGKIRVNREGLTGKPIEEIEADSKLTEWLDNEVATLYRHMPLEGHMANFFHCMRTREKPISDVWSHCQAVNACHMANIAMLTKQKITFDAEAFRFDVPEATALIQRQQRRPWCVPC
ncbi:MAG TPA: Gfo/Idh/MocA family oxidoreductase, partial [Pirellulaceae bacterium]